MDRVHEEAGPVEAHLPGDLAEFGQDGLHGHPVALGQDDVCEPPAGHTGDRVGPGEADGALADRSGGEHRLSELVGLLAVQLPLDGLGRGG